MKRRLWCLLLCLLMLGLFGCGKGAESSLILPAETVPPAAATAPIPAVLLPPASATPVPTPEPPPPEPAPEELVRVRDYLPGVYEDLRYAGTDNFTGKVIYDCPDAWLRYATVKKLQTAQETLRAAGFSLLIWDAYRPAEAQFVLWEAAPDPSYVANPYSGYSSHSCGRTVDVSLVTLEGKAVMMPSDFDEFSALADRDYTDAVKAAGEHALLLENAMKAAGFLPYEAEWWHYSDSDLYGYEDLLGVRPPREDTLFTPDCLQYISLRTAPDLDARILTQIPVGERFPVLGFAGNFVRIKYQGITGYVSRGFVQPAD